MSLTLREWEQRDGIDLTPEQVAALTRPKVIEVMPDLATRGAWKLRAGHHVGVLVVDGFELRIHPKVGVPRLLALLCESIGRVEWHDTDTLWAATDELLATIAGSFCTQAGRAIAKGVLQGYATVEDTLFGVKGRIDMSAQLSRRTGLAIPVEVIYDEYTVDIQENRLLYGAARQLLRIASVPATLQARLRRLASQLVGVTPIPAQPAPPAVEPTRLNSLYWSAITPARLILRSCALEEDKDEERDTRGSGLLVDMNKLFEDVVANGLRRAGCPSGVSFVSQFEDHLDAEERLKQITPDVVWLRDGTVRAVGDIKYKRPATSGVSNDDVFQVLAYASRYALDSVHLIYAERPPFDALHVAGTTIHLCHVDLDLPPAERQAQLDRIASTIVPSRDTALERLAP